MSCYRLIEAEKAHHGVSRLARYERDSERFYALVLLACSIISFKALQQPPW